MIHDEFDPFLNFNNYRITNYVEESLHNYLVYGLCPGGFLQSILENDVFSAAPQADMENEKSIVMSDLVKWILHAAPKGSYGNAKIVAGWMRKNKAFKDHQKIYKAWEKEKIWRMLKNPSK